jgi:Rad3-related DNA helicase
MITTDDWREFFQPTGEGIRPEQEKMVNFALNRLAEGVPNIWVEGPTGVGKSFAAYAIARYCAAEYGWKSRFLVPNVFLENQYLKDFARLGMLQLHSARHYECPEEGTCDLGRDTELVRVPQEIPSLGGATTVLEPPPIEVVRQIRCPELERCPYLLARAAFGACSIGVTNLAYGLTCARYGHDFVRSDLIFIDEAHTLADQVCSLYEVRIRLNTVSEPPARGDEIAWVEDFYLPDLERRIRLVEQEFSERAAWNLQDHELVTLGRAQSQLNIEIYNLGLIVRGDWTDWVVTTTSRELIFQLVWAKKMAPALLDFLAPRRVLMSATLLEFELQTKWLGLAV